jgi:hypothetical protein
VLAFAATQDGTTYLTGTSRGRVELWSSRPAPPLLPVAVPGGAAEQLAERLLAEEVTIAAALARLEREEEALPPEVAAGARRLLAGRGSDPARLVGEQLVSLYFVTTDRAKVEQCVRALETAAAMDDALLDAHAVLALGYFRLGRHAEGRREVQRAEELARAQGDRLHAPFAGLQALYLARDGDLARARAIAAEQAELARGDGPETVSFAFLRNLNAEIEKLEAAETSGR